MSFQHNYFFSLRIWLPRDKSYYDAVSAILGISPNDSHRSEVQWCHEKEVGPDDTWFDFINEFLNILEGKYEKLAELGIDRGDITVWMIYAYDSQCNMEFEPMDMKRLGGNGVKLCISCYDIYDPEEDTARDTEATTK